MIYLKNTTSAQYVRIPGGGPVDGTLKMSMVNTIDKGEGYDFEYDPAIYFVDSDGAYFHDADGLQLVVGYVNDPSHIYRGMEITLPEGMPDGEYEYTVTAGGEVISSGLAIVGEPKAAVTSYDKPIQYEQYIN